MPKTTQKVYGTFWWGGGKKRHSCSFTTLTGYLGTEKITLIGGKVPDGN
jgi:hypothetical protein